MPARANGADVVEIEIDGPHNESLRFAPQNRLVRGRWTWSKCGPTGAAVAALKWPGDFVPGQVIGVDRKAGTGYFRERLHEAEFKAVRTFIEEKRDEAIPEEKEDFPGISIVTWLFWMRRAVDGGHARVVAGELPSDAELRAQQPRLDFYRRPTEDPKDATINALLKILAGLVGEDKIQEALAEAGASK